MEISEIKQKIYKKLKKNKYNDIIVAAIRIEKRDKSEYFKLYGQYSYGKNKEFIW